MASKTDVLKKIYFDRSGFGSMQTTYKDAKQKDPSITLLGCPVATARLTNLPSAKSSR